MTIKKHLSLIPILLSPCLFSCSPNSLFDEIIDIEKRSLEQDYVCIKIQQTATAKTDDNYTSKEAQNTIAKLNSDEGICLVRFEDYKTYYYFPSCAIYFNNNTPQNVSYIETLNTYNYAEELKENTLFKDVEDYLKADNISVKKKKDGPYTYYDFTFKHFDNLFHKITNYEYLSMQENGDLILPSTLKTRDCVKDDLILYEEATIKFTVNKVDVSYIFHLDFSYEGSTTIPDNVKTALREDELDAELSNLEISHVKEINYDNKGNLPSLEEGIMQKDISGKGRYFRFSNSSYSALYGDGEKYIVYHDDHRGTDMRSKITVYDAASFKELYTVTFQRDIQRISHCHDGKIVVSFELKSKHSSPVCVYSLADFSLLGTVGNGSLIIGDNIYYQTYLSDRYDLIVFNTKTGEKQSLYSFLRKDVPADNVGFMYYFYHSQENNLLFMYYQQGNILHYAAYNALTNEKIYEYETDQIHGEWASSQAQQLDYGFSFDDCSKMIDLKTGQVVDYFTPISHRYLLPESFKDYEIRGHKIINNKYDVIRIYHEEPREGSWTKIIDEQYWIYDKENELFVAHNYLNRYDGFITDNNYFVCLTYNIGALIKLN